MARRMHTADREYWSLILVAAVVGDVVLLMVGAAVVAESIHLVGDDTR